MDRNEREQKHFKLKITKHLRKRPRHILVAAFSVLCCTALSSLVILEIHMHAYTGPSILNDIISRNV